MSDYFRHARIVTRALSWIRKTAPTPVAPNLGQTPDGIVFIDARQAAVQPATWLAAFQAAIDARCDVSDAALALIRQHAERFRVEDFFPTHAHQAALLRFLRPAPACTRACRRCTTAACSGACFRRFRRSRAASCATSSTSTRSTSTRC